jgi:hypothetical protein
MTFKAPGAFIFEALADGPIGAWDDREPSEEIGFRVVIELSSP